MRGTTNAIPNQAAPGQGLPQYVNGQSIAGTDVVGWYTAVLTHHPDVEEYPVMTADELGFSIVPTGFFDANPALDTPDQVP